MRTDYFAINFVCDTMNINVKSIYKTEVLDKDSFRFKLTDDMYYGYIVVISGQVILHTTQAHCLTLSEGDAVFVWSNDIQSYTAESDRVEFFWVWFSLFGNDLPLMNVFRPDMTEKDIKNLEYCIKLLMRTDLLNSTRVNMIFMRYLLDGMEKLQKEIKDVNNRYRLKILNSIDYIKENISQNPTVQGLADKQDMSLKLYRKYFKKITGDFPAKYIYKHKLLLVRDYLMNTDLNICQIADAVGFDNQYYLSNCFKKNFGVSPKEFRKQLDK